MQDSFWIALAAIIATPLISAAAALAGGFIDMAKAKSEKRREVLSEYLRWASVMVDRPSSSHAEEYRSSYGAALMYAPKSAINDMEALDKIIVEEIKVPKSNGNYENRKFDEMSKLFHKIFAEFSDCSGKPKAKK